MIKVISSYILVLTLLIVLAYGDDLYTSLFFPGKTKIVTQQEVKTQQHKIAKKSRKGRKFNKKNYYVLGRRYFRKGKCDEGNYYYRKALKLDPGNDQAYEKLIVYMTKCLKYKEQIKQTKLTK